MDAVMACAILITVKIVRHVPRTVVQAMDVHRDKLNLSLAVIAAPRRRHAIARAHGVHGVLAPGRANAAQARQAVLRIVAIAVPRFRSATIVVNGNGVLATGRVNAVQETQRPARKT